LLSVAQRYEILSCQPVETLTAADRDRLAQAAATSLRLGEALVHARAALAAGGAGSADGASFERQRVVVDLLLQLKRSAEAAETVRHWAAAARPAPEQLAEMAECLAARGCREPADELFAAALAGNQGLAPQQRFRLTCRQAAIHQGLRRWQLWLAAAAAAPADSPGRRQCIEWITAELTEPSQAEVAAQLALRAPDAAMKAQLMLAEADLTASPEERAALYRKVQQLGRLADGDFAHAYAAWNAVGKPEQVIDVAEARLRNGKWAGYGPERLELALAYRAVGRHLDALRAETTDPEPAEESPPPRPNRGLQGGGMF
jgi:hypothetical protein